MGTVDSVLKFRLSKEHLEMLDRYCKAIGENRSEMIRILISYAYDNQLFIIDEAQVNETELGYYKTIPLAKFKDYKKVKQKKNELFAKVYDEYDGNFSNEDIQKNLTEIHEAEYDCEAPIHQFYDIFDDSEESN